MKRKMNTLSLIRSDQRAKKAHQRTMYNFLACLCAVLSIIFLSALFSDPTSTVGITGLASMALIGSIGDVSDQFTTGDNIAAKVYLVHIDQIDTSQAFPSPNSSREVGTIPLSTGEYMHYFECHSSPVYGGTGEKGDVTVTGTNTMTLVMGGNRAALLNFAEQYVGGKFILLFKDSESTQWNILGSYDRPVHFKSFDNKNDKDGRYVTYVFERASIKQYYLYTGNLVLAAPGLHTAGATALAIATDQNRYTIPNGTSATYAIATVTGLTASDKGRIIDLYGTGTTYPATIPEGATFLLIDAATWTAKAGSKISFRVMDNNTLIEIEGTRVQTA